MEGFNPPATPLNERVISGPHVLFEGSMIIEFLEPHPSREATCLFRTTLRGKNQLCRLGKKHPWCPPLHLHFDQFESFTVLSGRFGTTQGWSHTEKIATPADGTVHIKPWLPHSFWVDQDYEEDSTMIIWAHPTGVPDPMDMEFFRNFLLYLSDVHEGKAQLSLLQIMLIQDVSASTLVLFPTAWWLGPLRWWIPYKLQALCAQIAVWMGKKPLMEKYTKAD